MLLQTLSEKVRIPRFSKQQDKKLARLYEQGASKKRIGQYLAWWLGWATLGGGALGGGAFGSVTLACECSTRPVTSTLANVVASTKHTGCSYSRPGGYVLKPVIESYGTMVTSAPFSTGASSPTCGMYSSHWLSANPCPGIIQTTPGTSTSIMFVGNSTVCAFYQLDNGKQIQLQTTMGTSGTSSHSAPSIMLLEPVSSTPVVQTAAPPAYVPPVNTASPIPTHTLTIETPENGMIAGHRGWIACGGNNYKCAEKFDEGLDVRLTATPLNGYLFESWTGDCSGNENKFRFTIESSTTCSATFSKIPEPVRPTPVSQPTEGTTPSTPQPATPNETPNEEKTGVYSLGPTNNGDYLSTVRTTNVSTDTITITVTLYADNGAALGTTTLTLEPQQSTDLTPTALKKLMGITDWASNAWLEFKTLPGALKVDFLLTNADGTVSNLTQTRKNAVYNIPNTGNAYGDVLYLQFNNTSDQTATDITGTLYAPDGKVVGNAKSLLMPQIAPKTMHTLTSDMLEQRVGATWQGRGWLQLDPEQPDIDLLALFQSKQGHFNNMTPVSSNNTLEGLPGTANPEDVFIRIINTSDQAVQVMGTLFDSTGQTLGLATLADNLPANAIQGLKMRELEKLVGIQPQKDKLKLVITSPTSGIAVAGYIRTPKGNVSNASVD